MVVVTDSNKQSFPRRGAVGRHVVIGRHCGGVELQDGGSPPPEVIYPPRTPLLLERETLELGENTRAMITLPASSTALGFTVSAAH